MRLLHIDYICGGRYSPIRVRDETLILERNWNGFYVVENQLLLTINYFSLSLHFSLDVKLSFCSNERMRIKIVYEGPIADEWNEHITRVWSKVLKSIANLDWKYVTISPDGANGHSIVYLGMTRRFPVKG